MKEIIEAYRQFPIWFQKTQWKNIQSVQQIDFTHFPMGDDPFFFRVRIFDTTITVKLTFERFLSIYEKNNKDISVTYDILASKIKDEYYNEAYKIFKNFVGDISNE